MLDDSLKIPYINRLTKEIRKTMLFLRLHALRQIRGHQKHRRIAYLSYHICSRIACHFRHHLIQKNQLVLLPSHRSYRFPSVAHGVHRKLPRRGKLLKNFLINFHVVRQKHARFGVNPRRKYPTCVIYRLPKDILSRIAHRRMQLFAKHPLIEYRRDRRAGHAVALCAHTASHQFGKLLYDTKSKPDSLGVALSPKGHVFSEHLVYPFFRHSRSRIGHLTGNARIIRIGLRLKEKLTAYLTGLRELDCIHQQILYNLPHAHRISLELAGKRLFHFHRKLHRLRLQIDDAHVRQIA